MLSLLHIFVSSRYRFLHCVPASDLTPGRRDRGEADSSEHWSSSHHLDSPLPPEVSRGSFTTHSPLGTRASLLAAVESQPESGPSCCLLRLTPWLVSAPASTTIGHHHPPSSTPCSSPAAALDVCAGEEDGRGNITGVASSLCGHRHPPPSVKDGVCYGAR